MAKLIIDGFYLKQPEGYFNTEYSFKLVKAKRLPSNKKPSEFLILKPCCGIDLLPDGKKERYVSGIFWTSDTTFKIDFDGIAYKVEVLPEGFQIDKISSNKEGRVNE